MVVRIQEIGKARKMTSHCRKIGNMQKIQKTRNAQVPTSEVMVGSEEWDIPRSTPDKISIAPTMK